MQVPEATDYKHARRLLLEAMPKNGRCIEIGVNLGMFSREIFDITQPSYLGLIDPWQYEEDPVYERSHFGGARGRDQSHMDKKVAAVAKKMRAEIQAGKVELLRGLSSDFYDHFPEASLDWVYVDGNHLYEHVKGDLEAFWKALRPGGYMTGDDYTEGRWYEGGVKRAVDEFVAREDAELLSVQYEQFIIGKRGDA